MNNQSAHGRPAFVSPSLSLALALVMLMALSGCAQHPARDEADASVTPVPTPAETTPLTPPQGSAEEAAAAAEAQAPAEPEPSAAAGGSATATAPVTQGRPYAFVCVPYDDRPKPAPRKTVRKDTPVPVAPAQPAPAASEVLTDQKSSGPSLISILGKKVFGRNGEDMGRVVDVLADRDGRPRAAIIDFGGFLGVGNRRVAVDWRSLQIDPGNADKPVILSLSREQVNAAPEFKESEHPEQAIVTDPSAKAPAAPTHP